MSRLTLPSRSHAFLIELTLAILFFAFVSAIAISVFVKASEIDQNTGQLTTATMVLQTLAETVKTEEEIETLRQYTAEIDRVFFDRNGQPVPSAVDAVFLLRVSLSEEDRPEGTMATLFFEALDPQGDETSCTFDLSIKKFYPEVGQ